MKGLIEKQGLATLVIDFGVMDEPTLAADVTREEVARGGEGATPCARVIARTRR